MSTYSSLKFELILTGDQSGQWGNTTNANIGTAIEQAIVGMATLTSANFPGNIATLALADTNAAQNARALCLNIDSAALSAAGTINVPAIQKPYIIINGSSHAVTVKVSGLTGVTVPSGKRTVVYNNGTDVGNQIDYLATLALGTALPATSGGTAQSTYTTGDTLYSSAANTLAKLAGNITSTRKYLVSVGTGTVATAPDWDQIDISTGDITGTLPATNGGTAQSTYTTGDTLYSSAANTLAKLAGNITSTRKYLVSVGTGTVATAPDWDQIDIGTTDITGTLAATNGGTGTATTTVGDILYGGTTSNTWAKLAAGTAGQLLQTNGAAAPSWVNAPTFTGVSSFTGGSTGLLPSTASTGAISLSGTLAISSGGTGATTQQAAINALAGAVTIRKFLRGDGTNVSMADIEVADVPTLNQSTTGTAGGLGVGIVLPVASGGTSWSGYSTGDILYASAPGTLSKLAAGTQGYALLTGGPALAPSWGQIALGSAVSGTLPVANGGTGSTTPSLVAGTNVTITGTWPNQTINSSGGGGTPGGSNTQVQFNSSGSFGGSSAFTWDGASITVNSVKVGRGNGNLANNIAIGNSLLALTGGSAYNLAIGYLAMQYATTAAYNVALGSGAIFNARDSTNSFNVAIGQDAGGSLDSRKGVGYGNNFIGYQSGGLYTGSYNVTLGHLAGTNMSFTAQTTPNDYNVVIGGYACIAQNNDSNNCTFVGGGAQQGWNGSITNAATFGYQATVTGSNQIQLGNSSTTTYVYGTVGNRSDARDKTDIRDTQLGLDFITALRPVDFKWDYREDYVEQVVSPNGTEKPTVTSVQHAKDGSHKRNRYHHGLIAQEVKAVLDAKGIDFGGYQDHSIAGGKDVLSIGYNELVGPLVKAIQELTARLEALEARN